MKKAFILSILLHITVIFIYTQLLDIKKEPKKEDFLYADIVKPEILKKDDKEIVGERKKTYQSEKSSPRKGAGKRQKDVSRLDSSRGLTKAPRDMDKKDRIPDGSVPIPSLPSTTVPSQSGEPTTPKSSRTEDKDTTRDRLFDRKIVRDIARANKPEKKQDDSITFDTKEFKYHGYLKRLRDRIEGVWKYPQEAAERGIYGDLYIKFTINKNGRLGDVELLRTSGHRMLDESAIKALRDADPFWPLPDELGKESFTITGHFVYSIYGIYLR